MHRLENRPSTYLYAVQVTWHTSFNLRVTFFMEIVRVTVNILNTYTSFIMNLDFGPPEQRIEFFLQKSYSDVNGFENLVSKVEFRTFSMNRDKCFIFQFY